MRRLVRVLAIAVIIALAAALLLGCDSPAAGPV